MNDPTDTVLNLWVFAFLGLVLWLLIKPAKGLEARRENEESADHSDVDKSC